MKYFRHIFTCVLTTASLLTSVSAVTITSQPISKTINQGQATSFSVAASGTGTLSYQWQKDGLDIPGAVVSVYAISNAKPWFIGNYSVKINDSSTSVTSNVATLSINGVNSGIWRGLLTYYPFRGDSNDQSLNNKNASPNGASLAADRYGRASEAYNLDGQNDWIDCGDWTQETVFTISMWVNSSVNQTGYSVILDNSHITGNNFVLQQRDIDPVNYYGFISDPSQQIWSDIPGGQWQHLVIGQTSTTKFLYLNGALISEIPADPIQYSSEKRLAIGRWEYSDAESIGDRRYWAGAVDDVRIYNRALSAAEILQLYVHELGPVITEHPTSRSNYAGLSTTFTIIAAGTGTINYQWRKNGVNIPTATNSSFTLSTLNYLSAANYDVVVTDDVGSVTSEAAELTVLSPAPNVSISPGDTIVALGGGLTFTATVNTGIPPFTYQWRKNSVLIAKATNPTLVLTNIQRIQEGIYDVVVKNAFGVDVSSTARLSLPPLVAVTASPADTAVNPGQSATFTVDVPGATAWQWLKNGVAIKNATASTLGVLNVDASSAGLYSVTVTTPAGKVTTSAAQLRVNDSGLLIYKLTGTGTAYEGTVSTVAALSGYMVLDRAGQRGGLILGSKRGSQSIHSLEVHENLHTQSTGPVPKTQTEVSEMVADEFVLWVNGADSLLTIQKTLSRTDLAVGPATLKGYANSIDIGTKVRIETVSLTLVLDAVNSIPARQNAETVEQAMSRISQDMQLKGSALVE